MIDLKNLILQIADETGKIQMKYFRTDKVEVKVKNVFESGAQDFVTNVDKLTEKRVIEIIEKAKMDCKIISEESGERKLGKSEYTWIIDPIDGTYHYSVGSSDFCFAMALLKKEKLLMGLLNFPARNEIYFAERDKGAFLNGIRLHVSKKHGLNQCRVSLWAFPANYDAELTKKIYSKLVDSVHIIYSIPQNFAMRDLASGGIDGAINVEDSVPVWDFIPGLIIAKEAGAVVTDFEGKEITNKGDTFVAGNKEIHRKLLDLINPK